MHPWYLHSGTSPKAFGVRRGTPLDSKPKNNASKGRCVTVTPRVIGCRLRFSSGGNGKLQLGGTKQSRDFAGQRSPLGDVRQPGAVALQSKSGTRCYSLVSTGECRRSCRCRRHWKAKFFRHALSTTRSANGEGPRPVPLRFSVRHEWFEKPGQYLGRNANSGIGNAQHNLILHEIGSDGENSTADQSLRASFFIRLESMRTKRRDRSRDCRRIECV